MAYAHSQRLAVLPNGGLYDFPFLISSDLDPVILALASRLRSVANGGECGAHEPVFYADSALTDLLPFETVEYDPVTGLLKEAWAGEEDDPRGFYYMAWGATPALGSSLEDPDTVWAAYVSTPSVAEVTPPTTHGFVGHFSDDAADSIVHNSCNSATGEAAWRGNTDLTEDRTTVGLIGKAFDFPAGSGFDVVDMDEIIRLEGATTPELEIQAQFKLRSYNGAGSQLVCTYYFSDVGYAFKVTSTGFLLLAGTLPGPLLTGTTHIALDTVYKVTAQIDHGVGTIKIGKVVEATGALNNPSLVGVGIGAETTIIGGIVNGELFDGVIDEVRIRLAIGTVHEIPDVTPPSLVCDELPSGEAHVPYTALLTATGGVEPYTFSIISGALPNGLSLNSATGLISGIPTESGDFTFTARVTDANDDTDGIDCEIVITIEECGCCVSTQIQVINQALLRIGVSQTITALDEASREAYTGALLFLPALQETLRAYPWSFATKYLKSTDAGAGDDMELIDGEPTDPINGDWVYSYRYPTDCLFARRLVNPGSGRRFDRKPIPFRVGRTITGVPATEELVIFTNQVDAQLEYTVYVPCSANFSDALFENALAWNLASKMAPSLSREPKMAQMAWGMYLATFDTAAVVSSREHQPEAHGEAEWIEGR
jgi:hypothetical protein